MESEVLLQAEGVAKKFCRSLKRSLWYGLSDIAGQMLPGRSADESATERKPLRKDEFWAVDGVSFELRRGECLGLVGRNGAGKTTLLKMLTGLITPDGGRITTSGRVGALIALGAGFNPVLTGRENVYVNASVLGLSKKEIDEKIEDIIDFADIGPFIDAPVQNYSSGMQVRLGFAVATAIQPDILILDEVLAVGDANFRHKCYSRIQKLMSNAAVVLVSHSMDYIAVACNKVGVMSGGRMRVFDDVVEGVRVYNESNVLADPGSAGDDAVRATYAPIVSADLRIATPEVRWGERLTAEVEIEVEEDIDDLLLNFTAVNRMEQPVMCWHSTRRAEPIRLKAGRQLLQIHVDPLLLHDGVYTCNLLARRPGAVENIVWFIKAAEFKVTSRFRGIADIPYLVGTDGFDMVTSAKSRDDGKLLTAA